MLAWLLRLLPQPTADARAEWGNGSAELQQGIWRCFLRAVGDESQPLQKLGLMGLKHMLLLSPSLAAMPAVRDELLASEFVTKLLDAFRADHNASSAEGKPK